MPPQQMPFAGGESKFFNLQQFGTLNTKALRPSIGDQDFSWIQNMIPIGDGNLRALPGKGPVIYTAPAGLTIIYMYFFNIGATQYAAVFLSDGTAVQVNILTTAVTTITSAVGTFFPGSNALNNPAPAATQYGQSGIVIVTTASPNGYYAWDGTTLYSPGQAAPNWLTNSTPTAMATGISGTCVDTYQNRVWVGNGAQFSFSAPGNGASFSGVIGGGTTPSNDSFLRREITQVRQSNGFLYLFADSSVNVISNVQTAGSPILTTMNNQNVDPQVGTPYHNSVQAFGRGLVFAHDRGVYALIGGAAQKVSDMLDGIFNQIDTSGFLDSDATINQPSSAVAELYTVKVYMLLLPLINPLTGIAANGLVMWDGKKWFLGSQESDLTFIASQEINSELSAYGTNGKAIFQLFGTPSSSLNKIWQTRLWPGEGWQITKQAMRLYTQAQDNSGSGYSITGTVDYVLENAGLQTAPITITSSTFAVIWQNASLQTIQWQNSTPANVTFTVSGLSLGGFDAGKINARGNLIGLTLQSTSSDFTIVAHSMLYQNQSPLGA